MSGGRAARQPRLLVLSSLFPSDVQPGAGLFIRERMFRVAQVLPIIVVAPQPWFPLQGLIRRFRPHFRPMAARSEAMQGIEVHRPRFLCFPGILKWTDGLLMAVCSYPTVRRLVRQHSLNVLDVHFGYPDGAAGRLLARWLGLPMVLTLRGKEERQARTDVAAPLKRAVVAADQLITVSDALRKVAIGFGANARRITPIGNGVELTKFMPVPQDIARAELKLPADAKVLVTVGGLVERKGLHRVIECLPDLLRRHPNLHYVVVGGASPEGDMSAQLRAQVDSFGLQQHVHFVGPWPPERLKVPLSAADVFVLASSYEGWANVFLEAMACGLPVVTTRVGGNAEVVGSPELGTLVEFGNRAALTAALDDALARTWDRERIIDYARANAWDRRIPQLLAVFEKALHGESVSLPTPGPLRAN
jgi:glycosyltransferase involved in cell wall biosynthesis